MTKLEELMNEFFATEGLTVEGFLETMRTSVSVEDYPEEIAKLLHFLNEQVK